MPVPLEHFCAKPSSNNFRRLNLPTARNSSTKSSTIVHCTALCRRVPRRWQVQSPKVVASRLRLSGKLGSVLDTDPFEKYFKYSGLPKIVLKQICIESGILPDRQIDFDRFAQCCRMIAHCQSSVVRCDLAVIRTMELGGHGLRRMLRQSLVTAPFMRPNCVTAFGRHVAQSYLSCKAIVEGGGHFA